MTKQKFLNNFLALILMTWVVPPIFGLSFLVYIEMFSLQQMEDILLSPVEPVFVVTAIIFVYWYFRRYANPILNYFDSPSPQKAALLMQRLYNFPLHYWGIFLTYLLLAPYTVIISAEYFSDFSPRPIDWFRIYLVALIVSIIVGLPIFYSIIDLFGKLVATTRLEFFRPHVSLKLKVFLIGSLVPLLIDTLLVQYFWTRTGYFTFETFIIWLALELLAIGGTLIFLRSISQSLKPLEGAISTFDEHNQNHVNQLLPLSTDELGVLTIRFRQLLQSLQNQKSKLELEVAERTEDLARANRELEAFSYSASHDLQQPLRTINGFCQALIEDYGDSLDTTAMDYLNRISKSTDKMSNLIKDLMTLSNISRKNMESIEVNLSGIAEEVINELKVRSPHRAIEINIDKKLRTTGDEGFLRILLDNLISNAWKYTARNQKAEIEVGYDSTNNAFFVKDNGIGFKMEDAKRIFSPFQRLHSHDDYPGTGIGLATVQRIITRHKGKIWVNAEEGKGASFQFTLDGK